MVSPIILVGPVAVLVVILVYVWALRSRHHYTSVLTCPRCGRTFEYKWVPLVSFSAIRLATDRYMQCPLCKEWAMFNIWDTRKRESAGAAPAETIQNN
jgi:hypothetical protein